MPDQEEQAADVGLTNTLGQSELDILDMLWRQGELTVRQAYEEIRKSRNVSLPAVMLSMERLTRRGVILKSKGNRAAVYRPLFTRESIANSLLSDVADKVLQGSTAAVVSQLVGRLNKSELEEIAKLIRKIRKS